MNGGGGRDGVPARGGLDHTAGLLLEGYRYLGERRRWGAGACPGDRAVEMRVLGERVVCVGGADGARLFYGPERFRRRDAIPRPLGARVDRSFTWRSRTAVATDRANGGHGALGWRRAPPRLGRS